jgi:PAS domain S-box-containing protein
MIDMAGRILLVNRQIEIQFGYTRDELVGQSVEYLIPERFRVQHQGHRARFLAAPAARPMGTGRDLFGLRKNGTEFPIEIGLQPITTATGRHVLASIVDTTERRHKEHEILESEERFRTMADTAPVLIWMSGPDKLCTYFNKGWLEFRGRTMDQELGNGWAEGVHPDDLDRCLQTYHEAFDCRRPFIMEYRLKRSDGVYRWMLDTGNPRITRSGDFAGYIGSCMDISDRKAAEEDRMRLEAQIRHTQKMEAIATLAGGIAHEFNNSLTAILGFSELALRKIPPDTRAHAQIQQVIKAGRRSRDLVHQILTFSRKTEQERRPLSFDGLLKEAVKLLRPTLPPTIELHECIASPTHQILADPTQLHQLVLNLWTNAVHAMSATGGRLDIRLENVQFDADTIRGGQLVQQGSYVRLLIQDTGTGMDPEVKARMFDPFFTTKDVNEHTGMGLAVVYGIVTLHGGRLCVESWPGNGTMVEVYLPTMTLTDGAEPSGDAPLPRGYECVLFVEDEPQLAELGREMLESLGYYTVVRTSAADALAAFSIAPQRFDLVITDYVMPDMTGDRLAQELFRLRPDIPILLCTGTPLPRQSLLSSGIRATLHKPLFARDVAIALRCVLDHPVTNGTPRASVPSISEELHAVGPDR